MRLPGTALAITAMMWLPAAAQPPAPVCPPSDGAAVVAGFMAALMKADIAEAGRRVQPDTVIIFGRGESSERNPLYGSWRGADGAGEVIRRFHRLLVPGSVRVDLRFAQADLVVLQGSMVHRARVTGKPFASDWALIARVCGEHVTHYQFYEDTAALEEALAPLP